MTLPGAIQGCQFERPVIKKIGFDRTDWAWSSLFPRYEMSRYTMSSYTETAKTDSILRLLV
jgi:hypothetical protein